MGVETSAVSERLPLSRRLRRTTHPVEIPDLIARRKVAAEAAAIAELRHPAVARNMAAVRLTAVVDLTAGTTADSRQ